MKTPCYYHEEHVAEAVIVWDDDERVPVCRPAANAARRWTTAEIEDLE